MSKIALASLVALICLAMAIAWMMVSRFSPENRLASRCFATSNLLFAAIAILYVVRGEGFTFSTNLMAVFALALTAYGGHCFLRILVPTKTVIVIVCIGVNALVLAEFFFSGGASRLKIMPTLIALFAISSLLYSFEPIRKEFGLLPATFVALALLVVIFACANVLAAIWFSLPGSMALKETATDKWYVALIAIVAIWLSIAMSLAYFMHTRSWRLLSDAAKRDGLTSLYSLSEFHSQSSVLWEKRRFLGATGVALAIDIDYFKAINDKHGHLAGNEVLIVFSKILWSTFDRSALLGRTGGEEFGVILAEASTAQVTLLVEQLMRRVARASCIDADGQPIRFTVSVGIAFDSPSDTQPDDILRRADKALYEAKHGGRNRFVYA
jgi:diguanylate cyclase (GGDEF)-like protein